MVRFKRSLATRPVLETAPAKVAKSTILNEGFALPSLVSIPIQPEEIPEPVQRDGPEALPYGRGNRDTAMVHARDPAKCRAALLKDSYAKTSMGPIESRIKRWDVLARTAGFHDPFDLNPEVIYAVMGALKLAGYRSAEQYLEAAKLEFFNSGGVWSDQLRQAARAAARSCNRGIGCAKQAKGLPLAELHKVKSGLALVPGGPIYPQRKVRAAGIVVATTGDRGVTSTPQARHFGPHGPQSVMALALVKSRLEGLGGSKIPQMFVQIYSRPPLSIPQHGGPS